MRSGTALLYADAVSPKTNPFATAPICTRSLVQVIADNLGTPKALVVQVQHHRLDHSREDLWVSFL